MWQVVQKERNPSRARVINARRRAFQQRAPRWRGWQAKKYGPGARYSIPRMPLMYWRMEGYRIFGWVPRERTTLG